jgi:hypothetical protein
LYGAGTKSRTRDLLITSQLLYQLSYTGICAPHYIDSFAGVKRSEHRYMQVLLSALKCLCTYAVHLVGACAGFVRWFTVFAKCMFLINIF